MSFIDDIKNKAKLNIKTIVLPEATDLRVLQATATVLNEGFANIVLMGNEDEINNIARKNNIDISRAKIEDPSKSEKLKEYAGALFEARKHKGMSLQEAEELVYDPIYYGVIMVKLGDADGLVSGAIHSTADTLRPALQILKTNQDKKLVSSFFIMKVPDCQYGKNGLFVFADCGLNQNPNEEELAEIAISSSESFKNLVGAEPKVAMLSYSTYGSAKSESVYKVQYATKLVKQTRPDIVLDGELQLDSAIIPEVAKIKAPKSILRGRANVLIFPDLNSGNIAYKITQRLAKAEAYGPLCQGLLKPVNDLSRGCSTDDIVGVIAITAVQAKQN